MEGLQIRDTKNLACIVGEHELAYYDLDGKEIIEPMSVTRLIFIEKCKKCDKIV